MLQGGRKIFPEFYIRKVFLTQCVVAYINEGTRIRGKNSYLSRSEYLSTMLPRTTPSPYKKMFTMYRPMTSFRFQFQTTYSGDVQEMAKNSPFLSCSVLDPFLYHNQGHIYDLDHNKRTTQLNYCVSHSYCIF